MSDIFTELLNENKVLNLKPKQKLHNDVVEESIGADMETIVDPSEFNKTRIKLSRHRQPIEAQFRKFPPMLRKSKSNMSISDIEDSDGEYENGKSTFNEDMYVDDDERAKIEYLRTFNAFKKRGYDIITLDDDDSINKYKAVYDDLMLEVRRKSQYQFFTNFIWMVCWVVEKVVTSIGHGLKFEGWANNVWENIDEYKVYFDQMTRPIYRENKKTGKIIRIENPSIINKIYLTPEINLVFAIVRSAVTYTALRNISKLTDFLTNNNDDDDDDELVDLADENIPSPPSLPKTNLHDEFVPSLPINTGFSPSVFEFKN